MIGQQVPYTISQNVSFADQPDRLLRPSGRSTIRSRRSCRSSRARRRSSRPRTRACSATRSRTRRRTPSSGTSASSAGVLSAMAVELTYAGSAGKHLVFCYNPNEVQPGIGSQESRRLIQPLEPPEQHACSAIRATARRTTAASSRSRSASAAALQFLVSYTYGKALDYGGSAASGGGAVGNPQTVTNLEAGHGPAGFDVRHRAVISGVWELPWGPARRWLREGGRARRGGRRLAAVRHRDDHDRPAVHRVHADRRQQRRAELAEPDRLGRAGQSDGRSVVQPARLRRAAAEHLRQHAAAASSTARATSTSTRRCRSASRSPGARNVEFRWDAFNLFNHPGFGFPNQNFDSPDRRTHHVDRRRQPVDAVLVEVELLTRRRTAARGPRARGQPVTRTRHPITLNEEPAMKSHGAERC